MIWAILEYVIRVDPVPRVGMHSTDIGCKAEKLLPKLLFLHEMDRSIGLPS